MSVDVRTRADAGGPVPAVDPGAFFQTQLPEAAASAAERLAPAVRWFGLRPLVVGCDGGAWVLAARTGQADRRSVSGGRPGDAGAGLSVRPARPSDGPPALEMTPGQLTDLVLDRATPMAWFRRGTLRAGVPIQRLLDWWVLVRAALDGKTPYVPGGRLDHEMRGAEDLRRTFRPGDPAEEQRAFLERTGYLHVSGVFGADEMAAVSADMDAAAPGFRPGDGRSWWAQTGGGCDRLIRMLGFDEVSPTMAALAADDRLLRLGGLTGDGHSLAAYGRPAVEALVKPTGVVRGMSDLPWHKDCSFGRHSYDCCSLTAGIAVTGAGARSGQLRVLAGSHRALLWPTFVRPGTRLPAVDLPTRPGDVTVHLSCTLHMAQPPARGERRVLYASFGLPPRPPSGDGAERRGDQGAPDPPDEPDVPGASGASDVPGASDASDASRLQSPQRPAPGSRS